MNRRQSIKLTAALLGGAIAYPGCSGHADTGDTLPESMASLIDELADTVLPDSERSPGAKKAGVGPFIRTVVNDCMSPEDRNRIREGLEGIENKGFLKMGTEERHAFMEALDRESRANDSRGEPHFYVDLKGLVVWAYFSSETGQTLAQRHKPMPGMYKGDVPLKTGQPSWTSPGFSID